MTKMQFNSGTKAMTANKNLEPSRPVFESGTGTPINNDDATEEEDDYDEEEDNEPSQDYS